jgi:RNA polymerase sigma factor (sigma-70 family)
MTSAGGNTVISYLRATLCAGTTAGAPDGDLLEQFVAQRDEAAFAALLRRHGPMVWRVCQRLLTDRQDAEDAFQATFLVLARKAAAIRRRKLLANWLFGVARRAALHLRALRARRARHEQPCGDLPDVQATVDTPWWDDMQAVLDEELARLPAKYRLPLLLCGLDGMTHAEAGQYLGWPTGTVAGRLSRGRELLRSRLLRRGIMAPAAVLAAALAGGAASAAVPPQLVATSVRSAAVLVAAGHPAAAVASPAVALLVRGVLRRMFLSRLLTTTGLVAALALALAGAAAVERPAPPAEAPPAAPVPLPPNRLRPAVVAQPPPPEPERAPARRAAAGPPAIIRLPADADALVLRMDRAVDAAAGPGMALTVYADGRVVAEFPDGLLSLAATDLTEYAKARANAAGPAGGPGPQKGQVLDGSLSAAELQEVLQFALHDQEFFEFDPAAVKAAIRDKYQSDGNVSDSTDDTTTGLRIRTADRDHEVRWSRLSKAAWDFPQVERLLQLHAVDQRLSQVFYVLLAGGPERVETVVAKTNGLVRFGYPSAPWLTAADLFKVTPSPDGSQVEFVFSRNKDNKVRNPLFEVAVAVPRLGEPTLGYVIPPGSSVRGRLADGTPLISE